jgi:hypothetical protein
VAIVAAKAAETALEDADRAVAKPEGESRADDNSKGAAKRSA